MPEKREAVLVQDARVLTLKGTEEPPIVNGESPPYYHHLDLGEGLKRVVKIRERPRQKAIGARREEILLWYEKPYIIDTDIIPLIYPLSPMIQDNIMVECLYPVVIWNISMDRLTSEIHNRPFDKKFPIMDSNGNPVADKGLPIMVFHYVVINDRYTPNIVNGKSDDGNFQPGEPVIGRFIKEELNAMSREVNAPLDYPRK